MAISIAGPRVAVVGGGMAGLATAYYLGQAGVRVDVFEAEEELGGLARSFDFDGQRVERFYHFICRPDHHLLELADELGLAAAIQWRRSRTSYFHQGRLYPFTTPLDLMRFDPLPLRDRLALGVESMRWRKLEDWKRLDEMSARDWLIQRVGARTYEVIFRPLMAMKFGDYSGEVNAAWLWHRLHRVARSRKSPGHAQVMGYFRGGSEILLQRVAERIERQGGRIFRKRPVQGVITDPQGNLRGLACEDGEGEYRAVVLALPLPIAARLLPAGLSDFRQALTRIPFLGLICLVARLERGLTRSFWCNVHDDRLPLTGLIEMSELNPELGKAGPLIYVPHYLPAESERFSRPDEEFKEEFRAALPRLRPEVGTPELKSWRVFRAPFAQAVCAPGFERRRPPMATPLPGLFLLDSTHLYPEDRTLSGTIGKAREISQMMIEGLSGADSGGEKPQRRRER